MRPESGIPDGVGDDAGCSRVAGSQIVQVAAVARNGVIGHRGWMPWHLPGDLPRFKALTMGHPVVQGRATFEAIGRPFPGRTTIVVSRDPSWSAPGVVVAHSVAEALAVARRSPGGDRVMIGGGGQVYAATLPCADVLELTEVDAEPEGDTFFPTVDWSVWRECARVDRPGFAWVTYRRCDAGPGAQS